jgi:hypothetical protein
VREIVIVSHREPRLTRHRRQQAEWTTIDARPQETLVLESIGATLGVDDVYRDGLEDQRRG